MLVSVEGGKLEELEKKPSKQDKNQHQRNPDTILGPGFQPRGMMLDKPSHFCAIPCGSLEEINDILKETLN